MESRLVRSGPWLPRMLSVVMLVVCCRAGNITYITTLCCLSTVLRQRTAPRVRLSLSGHTTPITNLSAFPLLTSLETFCLIHCESLSTQNLCQVKGQSYLCRKRARTRIGSARMMFISYTVIVECNSLLLNCRVYLLNLPTF